MINHPIGIPFIELLEVDSTNNYAMAQVQLGAADAGSVYFAHIQIKGKGQRGKAWQTASHENLIMSVVLNTKGLLVSRQFCISAVIALATYDLFNKYTGEETKIKWPNDIYWRDRKAAGILLENVVRGMDWQWAVAGIGVNINQTVFDAALLNPVSLKQITGKTFDCIGLAKELCACLEARFVKLNKNGFGVVLKDYNDALYKKNETVRLKKKSAVFNCLIKGINEKGQLLVEGDSCESFEFGEVEWMR